MSINCFLCKMRWQGHSLGTEGMNEPTLPADSFQSEPSHSCETSTAQHRDAASGHTKKKTTQTIVYRRYCAASRSSLLRKHSSRHGINTNGLKPTSKQTLQEERHFCPWVISLAYYISYFSHFNTHVFHGFTLPRSFKAWVTALIALK